MEIIYLLDTYNAFYILYCLYLKVCSQLFTKYLNMHNIVI